MTALVPDYPTLLIPDGSTIDDPANSLRVAAPIKSAGQWKDWAFSINWLIGSGRQLVCGNASYGTNTSPVEFRSYMLGNEHLNDPVGRVWFILAQATSDVEATFTFAVSGDTHEVTITPRQRYFIFQETVSGTLPAPPVIGFDVTFSSGVVAIRTVTCTEIPLRVLQDGDGIDVFSLAKNAPLLEDSSQNISHYGVVLENQRRSRRNIFSWMNSEGIDTSSGSFTDIFLIDPSVQAQKTILSATTKTVDWAALVQGTGGDGEIRVSMTSGDSSTLAISTTLEWVTGVVDIEMDDPDRYDTDGGIRGGTRDEATFEFRCTTASSVTVLAICMGDA